MAVIIVTDSTSDFSLKEAKVLGVEVACLKVLFGQDEYVDKVSLTSEEFYQMLKASRQIPTTTLVSPQEFIELFAKFPNDTIVGIFISSKLSGTFQSAQIAKSELGRDDIYLVDSGSVSLGLGMLVERATRLRDGGMCAAEIYGDIMNVKEKLHVLAAMDTLEYLVKGGRLPATRGIVGSILNIKPLLHIYDGAISNIGKARGMRNALKELARIFNEADVYKNMPMAFAHSGNTDYLKLTRDEFGARETDRNFVIGSVVGTHAGPGAIAIAYFTN